MCILYVLLKVVGYYDLSEHSVHVSDGFSRWRMGGWGELYPSFFCGFLEFFNCKASQAFGPFVS